MFYFSFFNSHQARTFKTYRSLISDNQRNPTILSRLKEAYNQPGGKTNPLVAAQAAQTLQNESLTKLLNSTDASNLTPEQKQQLKVAFAEGYLAANHPENMKKDGRAMRYLRVFQQLLIIVVFMGIFVSLFAGNNGSVFRYVADRKQRRTSEKQLILIVIR
jgi:ATP-dependent metalloprotease